MPYLISYLLAGGIFAVSLLVNDRIAKGKRIVAFVVTTLAWPILVIAAPEGFLSSDEHVANNKEKDPLTEDLTAELSTNGIGLNKILMDSLARTAESGEKAVAYFSPHSDLNEVLLEFWDSDIPPLALRAVRSARSALEDHGDIEHRPLAMFSRKEPDWLVGFSNEFLKSISRTDAKLRGRVLDAISKISVAPMDAVGDTLKPLSATMSGMWRYRIGDHRLVYLPDRASRRITLLYFGSRGDIYTKV